MVLYQQCHFLCLNIHTYTGEVPFAQLLEHKQHARNMSPYLKAKKRSRGYRPLRKFEVQSYLTFHSLLDNQENHG